MEGDLDWEDLFLGALVILITFIAWKVGGWAGLYSNICVTSGCLLGWFLRGREKKL